MFATDSKQRHNQEIMLNTRLAAKTEPDIDSRKELSKRGIDMLKVVCRDVVYMGPQPKITRHAMPRITASHAQDRVDA
jgi:hypothetical protein